MRRKYLLLFILLIIAFRVFAFDSIPVSFVKQDFHYKTDYASEVYLVWMVNDWQLPAIDEIPKNAFIRNGMVYSLMEAHDDSFYVSLAVKENTLIHFYFLLSKDKSNKPSENWDTYYNSNYSLIVKKGSIPRSINSIYYERDKWSYDIFDKGWIFGITGFLILLGSLFFYKKNFRALEFPYLFIGYLLVAFVIMIFIRMQMNAISSSKYLIFGSSYYDFLFLIGFFIVVYVLTFFIKQRKFKNIFFGFNLFLIIIFVITSLCNIEVVRKLGRPLNYQWFYYSDFLQSVDAKSSLRAGITPQFLKGFIFILIGLITSGIGFALIIYSNKNSTSLKKLIIASILVFGIVGFVQSSNSKLVKKKIENPVVSFVSSWLTKGDIPELFTMNISDENKNYVKKLHSRSVENNSSGFPSIKHIVVFVFESTPAEYINIYNNKFNVTPNIRKWQEKSRVYKNMYAHIPSTPNSLFSLVSGVYPPISYRSVLVEKPDFPVTSVATLLRENGWKSCVYSAADLGFTNMHGFLYQQGFDTILDSRKIKCDEQEFLIYYDGLHGVDDKCLVTDFSSWLISRKNGKTFSIVWTMQTHYPYTFSDKEIEFVNDNPDFNKYLNALHHGDEAFGNLMDNIKNAGISNETLVIVVGDHGEAFGRHNQYTHASFLYEENIHVPCILINPVLFKGESDERLCSLIDIPATIAGITGNAIPEDWQGRSLFDPISKNQVFAFNPYSDFLFSTRKDNWKLIYNASTNTFELYDLSIDPEEKYNVAKDHPELVAAEFKHIAAWVQYQNGKMKNWLK